jgi:hypothetical protein
MVRPNVTASLRREAALAATRGRQKLALGLLICLPVPLLAMSGLAIPLPTAVYRAAAAIVQSTEGLARALTGTEQEADVLSARRTTAPIRPAPRRSPSSGRVVERPSPHRSSGRVQRAAEIRTRSFDTSRRKSSRLSQPSRSRAARMPSAPAPEEHSEAASRATPVAAVAAPVQAPAQEAKKEPSPVEPIQRPVLVVPSEPVTPPSPPPAPAPAPSLLDPVTKPLEPVTESLDPITKQAPVTETLEPITRPLEPVTGRLGLLDR